MVIEVTKRWALMVTAPLLAAGCIGPRVSVIQADGAALERAAKPVRIYEPTQGAPTGAQVLGAVTTVSCQNKIWQPAASAEDGLAQLRYRAALRGGNGLLHALCEQAEGTNLSKNCWSSVTCHGLVIKTSDDET